MHQKLAKRKKIDFLTIINVNQDFMYISPPKTGLRHVIERDQTFSRENRHRGYLCRLLISHMHA